MDVNNMICEETGCNNKVYSFNRLTPTFTMQVCKKHYRMYCLGWSEYEAGRGKKEAH